MRRILPARFRFAASYTLLLVLAHLWETGDSPVAVAFSAASTFTWAWLLAGCGWWAAGMLAFPWTLLKGALILWPLSPDDKAEVFGYLGVGFPFIVAVFAGYSMLAWSLAARAARSD